MILRSFRWSDQENLRSHDMQHLFIPKKVKFKQFSRNAIKPFTNIFLKTMTFPPSCVFWATTILFAVVFYLSHSSWSAQRFFSIYFHEFHWICSDLTLTLKGEGCKLYGEILGHRQTALENVELDLEEELVSGDLLGQLAGVGRVVFHPEIESHWRYALNLLRHTLLGIQPMLKKSKMKRIVAFST